MCDRVVAAIAPAPCAAAPVAGCVPAPNRPPQVFKEVTKVPGAPGKVTEVVRRLPTPTADLIDRTIIELPGQDTVNVIYERPTTPPPNVVERRLIEAPPPAQVNCFERRVPHRPRETVIAATAPAVAVAAPVAVAAAPVAVAAAPLAVAAAPVAVAAAPAVAVAGPLAHISTTTTTHVPVAPVAAVAAPCATRLLGSSSVVLGHRQFLL